MASTPPLSSLSDVSHARPPFFSAAAVALLLYDPNGHHASSNVACCCLSPASSFFSQFLLGFFRSPSPGLSCKQKSLSCSRYISLRTAIHESLEGSSARRRMPCAYAPCLRPRTSTQPPPPPSKSAPPPPCTFAPTLCSLHGVEPTQTRMCPRPPCLSPPPTAFLKAYALLSRPPVSDACTDRHEVTTSFLLGHRRRCDSPASRS
ncbi:hypothetical protein K438DRAFT_732700 [Mycena galopus ATCC 62051]|nr:hypothetical protein K438DRAFT_732700 [Mycena galopus ATCC 62051]